MFPSVDTVDGVIGNECFGTHTQTNIERATLLQDQAASGTIVVLTVLQSERLQIDFPQVVNVDREKRLAIDVVKERGLHGLDQSVVLCISVVAQFLAGRGCCLRHDLLPLVALMVTYFDANDTTLQ